MKPMSLALLGATLALFAASARADDAATRRRADIAVARAAIEQRFTERQHECAQRFIVTACLNDAQKERRGALGPLRQEELRIDAAERRQRAADRLDEIDAKQRADAARLAASSPDAGHLAASGPARLAAPGSGSGPRPPGDALPRLTPRPAVGVAERERREAESQARFDVDQADAAKHRAAVEARNARRAASGKVVKPLPEPEPASAATRR